MGLEKFDGGYGFVWTGAYGARIFIGSSELGEG